MISFKIFLLEASFEHTWHKYKDKLYKKFKSQNMLWPLGLQRRPEEYFHQRLKALVDQADPTPQKKYSQWILHHYANDGIRHIEDIEGRTATALRKFYNNRQRLAHFGINPNLFAHNGLVALENELNKLPKKEVPTDLGQEKARQETEHHEDEHWKIKIPKTKHASCYYGQGTKWCTASTEGRNYFSHYTSGSGFGKSPLMIFIPKKPKYPGEKYQVHLGTGSFNDEEDSPINPKKHPMHGRPSTFLHDTIIQAYKKTFQKDENLW